jgi:hypothetical protein
MLNERRWKDYGTYVTLVTMRRRKWGMRKGRKRMNKNNKQKKEICMLLENKNIF